MHPKISEFIFEKFQPKNIIFHKNYLPKNIRWRSPYIILVSASPRVIFSWKYSSSSLPFNRSYSAMSESLFCSVQTTFTLYRIGFCSISKVVLVQYEKELMFCCSAEIVPKRSQCEQKPYPSYNLQCSLLI